MPNPKRKHSHKRIAHCASALVVNTNVPSSLITLTPAPTAASPLDQRTDPLIVTATGDVSTTSCPAGTNFAAGGRSLPGAAVALR